MKKRIAALSIALVLLLSTLAVGATSTNSLALALTADVAEAADPAYDSLITYTLTITQNSGFTSGVLCIKPSSNLAYESATLFGEDTEAELFAEGTHNGEYGLLINLSQAYTESDTVLATLSFRVSGLGTTSLTVSAEQLINGEEGAVSLTVTDNGLSHTVATPERPVITTEALSEAVVGREYSFALQASSTENITFSLVDGAGALPAGITLLSNGTLSGTPTEFGSFTFQVKATVLETVHSDAKELTLIVLEKPKTIELTAETSYERSEGLLTKVIAKTTLAGLLGNFKNKENLKVFSASGTEITEEDAYIGTGCVVSLMNGDEAIDSATVVVRGDVDGDGQIRGFDYMRIRQHYMTNLTLTDAFLAAADADGDGQVRGFDYMRVRQHYMNNFDIYA